MPTKPVKVEPQYKVEQTQTAPHILISERATPPKAAKAVTEWADDQAKPYQQTQRFMYSSGH